MRGAGSNATDRLAAAQAVRIPVRVSWMTSAFLRDASPSGIIPAVIPERA
jgi:hypothetical protein